MKRDPYSDRLWHPIVNCTNHALLTHISKADLATLWHRRSGHTHPDAVIQHLKSHNQISFSRNCFAACDACTLGKLQQVPSTSSFHRATHILDFFHSDLIGPINPPASSGYLYSLTFVDDYTRYNQIYLLRHKSDVSIKFQQYKVMMENQTGTKIVKLKSDCGGGEYSSNELIQFLQDEGIPTERGPAERPMANLISKTFDWTLLSQIQSQLSQCSLPLSMWGKLASYCSLQINCSPS